MYVGFYTQNFTPGLLHPDFHARTFTPGPLHPELYSRTFTPGISHRRAAFARAASTRTRGTATTGACPRPESSTAIAPVLLLLCMIRRFRRCPFPCFCVGGAATPPSCKSSSWTGNALASRFHRTAFWWMRCPCVRTTFRCGARRAAPGM